MMVLYRNTAVSPSEGSVALAVKGALLDGFVPLRPQGTLLHGSGVRAH